jgi:hypothetical protein
MDIKEVEFDAVYVTDLLALRRMRAPPSSSWRREESQLLIKHFLESGSNWSVLKTDKHFGYIKDFYVPFFIMPDVCCQLK